MADYLSLFVSFASYTITPSTARWKDTPNRELGLSILNTNMISADLNRASAVYSRA